MAKNKVKIPESELKSILDEVADDLAKAFKAESVQTLAKADEKEEEPPPAEGSESSAPAESPAPPAPGPETPPGPGPADGPAPEASAPGAADPAAEDGPMTPEMLQSEYAKLPPEELDMHIQAALAAKASQAPAGAGPGAMPPGPGAMPPGPGAMPPPAMKSEAFDTAKLQNFVKSEFQAVFKGLDARLEKSIQELRALVQTQSETLKAHQEDIENLAKATQSLVQPVRKAVTETLGKSEVVANGKPQPKTMADVHEHLRKLARSPDLKKSDRQLINDFYEGIAKVSDLAPLFD